MNRNICKAKNFTCGNCSLWMRKDCPKEVYDIKTGRSRGPSMNSLICSHFVRDTKYDKKEKQGEGSCQ